MNLDGFAPTPVVGNQYKKADGTKMVVVDMACDSEQPYVLCYANKELNKELTVLFQDEWNKMQLIELSDVVTGADETESQSEYDIWMDELEKRLNSIQELRHQGESKRASFMNEFLWTCAGVDKPLLRMCPGDWNKKAGMGGNILGTAALAFLAGIYFAYVVSGNIWVSISIGIIWGVFVFNLDRYLTSHMYFDGTDKITLRKLKCASPRLVFAVLISLFVSLSISMIIFDDKIQNYIENQQFLQTEYTLSSNPQLMSLDKQIQNYQHLVDSLSFKVQQYSSLLEGEMVGTIPGYGPRAKEIQIVLDRLIFQLDTTRKELQKLYLEYEVATQKAYDEVFVNLPNGNGFIARLDGMRKVTGFYKPVVSYQSEQSPGIHNEYNPLFWIRMFITFFCMLIEITPVLAMMMASDGRYEEYINLESETLRVIRFQNEPRLDGTLKAYRQFLGLDTRE